MKPNHLFYMAIHYSSRHKKIMGHARYFDEDTCLKFLHTTDTNGMVISLVSPGGTNLTSGLSSYEFGWCAERRLLLYSSESVESQMLKTILQLDVVFCNPACDDRMMDRFIESWRYKEGAALSMHCKPTIAEVWAF